MPRCWTWTLATSGICSKTKCKKQTFNPICTAGNLFTIGCLQSDVQTWMCTNVHVSMLYSFYLQGGGGCRGGTSTKCRLWLAELLPLFVNYCGHCVFFQVMTYEGEERVF
jgi:hypothetical protein